MNDEATRKYLQAVKRLLTFLQRAYPTDPSRSVDFDGFRDAGLGAKGAGSDKAVSTSELCATHLPGSLRCLLGCTNRSRQFRDATCAGSDSIGSCVPCKPGNQSGLSC